MPRPDYQLHTAATMNGYKPVIFFEEAGLPYELKVVDFASAEQKAPDYLVLNPNGKIPTLVDRTEDRAIFESGAILWHLAEKTGQFLPGDPTLRSEVMQWMFFQVGHVGPMMGQAMYFQRIAAPNGHEETFSIRRYVDESRRLLEVLDRRLAGREFIVGEALSIADMMIYPWARAFPWARVAVDDLVHLSNWFERLDQRPAIQKALTIPKAVPAFWGESDDDGFGAENAARFAADVGKP